jgi:single-strand DNA-binding protein
MTDMITVVGFVATTPRHLVTGEGLAITSFRLASTQRRYDRTKSAWVDADTNWYTVTGFRQLAINAAGSVRKGDRIIATGRVRVRDWQKDSKQGTSVEIDADAIGHDLLWGTTNFTRSVSSSFAGSRAADAEDAAFVPPFEGEPFDGEAPVGAAFEGEAPVPTAAAVDEAGWAVPGGTAAANVADNEGDSSASADPGQGSRPDSAPVPF